MSGRVAQPLTPLTMAILLALAEEELHGYALLQEVAAQTDGAVVPGTGSLYAALERLLAEGLVIESPDGPGPREDRRRKYFRITPAGLAAARQEAQRLARVVELARRKSVIGGLAWRERGP